jgi:hypothetical protein
MNLVRARGKRFVVKRIESNGDVTCWGPVIVHDGRPASLPRAKMRSFKPDEVKELS